MHCCHNTSLKVSITTYRRGVSAVYVQPCMARELSFSCLQSSSSTFFTETRLGLLPQLINLTSCVSKIME